MTGRLRSLAREVLPVWVRRLVVRSTRWPPVGLVRFDSLRRLTPLSRIWGGDRGQPIDRHYIERFLSTHAQDIRGRVLEVAGDDYTRRFGGRSVASSDVLEVAPGNPKATVVADLACAPEIPSDSFDCVICTQTLQYIPDLPAAIDTLARILRPGGVLLVTLPGICQLSRYDVEQWGDYWRFTTCSAQWLFGRVFPAENLRIQAHGNVLAAIGFLHGVSAGELREHELDYEDPDYQVSITVRAVRPEWTRRPTTSTEGASAGRAQHAGAHMQQR